MQTGTSRLKLPVLAVSGIAALLLSGCSTSGAEAGPEGGGVPFGAAKEQYQAAFGELEPITLKTQVDSPSGSFANHGREEYFTAIEEWSGGKITFDVGYSNAYVPNPADWDDALADGRLDIGQVLPGYEPDIYPMNSGMGDASFMNGGAPVSTMITAAWMMEVFSSDQRYAQELVGEGVRPLVPVVPMANPTALFCTEPRPSLDKLKGSLISASGTGKTAEVERLGGAPVSMPFTEQFEALERGMINCAATAPAAAQAGGIVPLAPHVMLDKDVAMQIPTTTYSMSQATYNELPLVARQLLFDRLDVYLAETAWGEASRSNTVFEQAVKEGGGVMPFDPDAKQAIRDANRGLLDRLKGSGVDVAQFEEVSARWAKIVVDELGYYDGADWAKFVDELDASAYVDRVFQAILLKNRPE